MKMYINGGWVDSPQTLAIRSPYTHEIIDTVPDASDDQVQQTLASAAKGAAVMAKLTAYERTQILMRAADLLSTKVEDLARTVSMEEGKPMSESRGEAGRMADLLRLSAFEGSQVRGETLPWMHSRQHAASWASRCGFRVAWWSRSARSTTRSCLSCTRLDPPSPRVTVSFSSPPARRRCPRLR